MAQGKEDEENKSRGADTCVHKKTSHKERQEGQVENKIKVETQVQDEIESLCITINASLQNCIAAPDTKDIIEVQFCLTRFNGNPILQ